VFRLLCVAARKWPSALKRTWANETGLVAVSLDLSIPLHLCQGVPPPLNLSSREAVTLLIFT
jgi:hypothetical protein